MMGGNFPDRAYVNSMILLGPNLTITCIKTPIPPEKIATKNYGRRKKRKELSGIRKICKRQSEKNRTSQ